MLKKKTNLVDGSMYNEKYNHKHFSYNFYKFLFNCNHVRLLTRLECTMTNICFYEYKTKTRIYKVFVTKLGQVVHRWRKK